MASITPSVTSHRHESRALPYVKLALVLTAAVGQALAAPLGTSPGAQSYFSIATQHGDGGDDTNPHTTLQQKLVALLSIAGLVLLGGIFAGLTLALMGLDELHLQVLSSSGTDTERRRASKVLRLLEKGKHWVLVVLLLGNVIVNETLPVFLSDFGGGIAAVATSTVLIVIFGEILPQSICARYGLAIGAFCAPLVHLTMLVFAPVAWPTAKLLDWCLGEDHGTTYRKAELKTFVSLHQTLGAENLSEDEVTIIRAVLDLNDKTVKDVMTPIDDVFILSADTILDEAGVNKLVESGYSRVPVHEPGKKDAILGMLLVKKLIQYDPEDAMPVSWFNLTPLPEASPDLTLLDCLNYFQQGRSHMLLISSSPGEQKGAQGVVTLEDVIEEMIGEEIIDETDLFVDSSHKVRVERKRDQPGSQGAWAPLIKGIVERRRKFGGSTRTPLRSSYGVPASKSSGLPSAPPPQGGRAMDKVQIKRTMSPSGESRVGDHMVASSYQSLRENLLGSRRGSDVKPRSQSRPRDGQGDAEAESGNEPGEGQGNTLSPTLTRQYSAPARSSDATLAVSPNSVQDGEAAAAAAATANIMDETIPEEGQSKGQQQQQQSSSTTSGPYIVEFSDTGGEPEVVLTSKDIPREVGPSPVQPKHNPSPTSAAPPAGTASDQKQKQQQAKGSAGDGGSGTGNATGNGSSGAAGGSSGGAGSGGGKKKRGGKKKK